MARKTYRNVVVGLDIGSNKVASAAGEITFDGAVNVLGICNAFHRAAPGNVIDLEDTAHAIDDRLNELENCAYKYCQRPYRVFWCWDKLFVQPGGSSRGNPGGRSGLKM